MSNQDRIDRLFDLVEIYDSQILERMRETDEIQAKMNYAIAEIRELTNEQG